MRLPRGCLAVREDGSIEAVESGLDDWGGEFVVDVFVGGVLFEDGVVRVGVWGVGARIGVVVGGVDSGCGGGRIVGSLDRVAGDEPCRAATVTR